MRALTCVLLAGCRLHFDSLGDAGAIEPPSQPIVTWNTPQVLPTMPPGARDPTLSHDGLELLFVIDTGGTKLMHATRPDTSDVSFGTATELVLTSGIRETPRLSRDGNTLYFSADLVGNGNTDVYVATRPGAGTPWTNPTLVAELQTAAIEKWLSPCAGDRYVFVRQTENSEDLFEGVLGTQPVPIDFLNTSGFESSPFLTSDCLTLYFTQNGDSGLADIFVTHRDNVGAAWDVPARLSVSLPTVIEEQPTLSGDDSLLVFRSGAELLYATH